MSTVSQEEIAMDLKINEITMEMGQYLKNVHNITALNDCEKEFVKYLFSGKDEFLLDKDDFHLEILGLFMRNSDFMKHLPVTGINIKGGNLICETNTIDLSRIQFKRQIKITDSYICAGLNISYCTLRSFILESCRIPFIQLDGSTIKGNLYIRNCKFFDPTNSSMHAENLNVEGSVFCTESVFISGVNLRGSRIRTYVNFADALCISSEISANMQEDKERYKLKKILSIDKPNGTTKNDKSYPLPRGEGTERLQQMFNRMKKIPDKPITYEVDNIIERLNDKIEEINEITEKLQDKWKGDRTEISHSEHHNKAKSKALCLQKTFVGASINLGNDKNNGLQKGFLGIGEVTLSACRTNGSILCSGGYFLQLDDHPKLAVALCLDALYARLSIFLDKDFLAHGTVSLRGVHTQHRLICKKAMFIKTKTKEYEDSERENYAFFAKLISIRGDTVIHGKGLSDPAIWGRITFENGQIGGDLHLCAQKNPLTGPSIINLHLSKIIGELKLITCTSDKIDLSFSEIGQLSIAIKNHTLTEWKLNGMKYHSIDFNNSVNEAQMGSDDGWLEVLKKQAAIQPFNPFISYLRMAGMEHRANNACYHKERQITNQLWKEFKSHGYLKQRCQDLFSDKQGNERKKTWAIFKKFIGEKISTFPELFFRKFIVELFVGYGYKWGRGILFLVLLIIIGGIVFDCAHRNHAVFPSRAHIYAGDFSTADKNSYAIPEKEPSGYPHFIPLLFSLDAAIPGLDIGQESHWEIKYDKNFPWFELYFYVVHVPICWLLSILLVLSPTKLLHRE